MSNEIKSPFWNRTTLMVVTGASQGIGRHIAIEFSQHLNPKSAVLLLARSEQNLKETKQLIVSKCPGMNVDVYTMDLSHTDIDKYRSILNMYKNNSYELSFIVHDAASIICDIPASKMSDMETWHKYMSLNLYSVAVLTSVFLELFTTGERCLLNITSLAGVEPMKGLGYYCIGKASREMYFRVLAEENPSLNILNYSPGPVDTAMFSEIGEKCCDPDLKTRFVDMKSNKSAVKMEDTILKLINTLKSRNYKSGGRIDYFDR